MSMKNLPINGARVLITTSTCGAYLHDEAGMKWLSLNELSDLARAFGFASFWCLRNRIDKLGGQEGGRLMLRGRGRRLKVTVHSK